LRERQNREKEQRGGKNIKKTRTGRLFLKQERRKQGTKKKIGERKRDNKKEQ
jgi:hypothetical protein